MHNHLKPALLDARSLSGRQFRMPGLEPVQYLTFEGLCPPRHEPHLHELLDILPHRADGEMRLPLDLAQVELAALETEQHAEDLSPHP